MASKKQRVTLVFRKSNPGNYSIESIYKTLLDHWKSTPLYSQNVATLTLNYNYDLLLFLKCFIRSFFNSKRTVHITGGCNYMVMAFPFKKRILTIHDLFYLDQKTTIKSVFYTWLFYSLPIVFSHRIIAVSNTTKSQLIARFPKAEQKIVVIPNPLVLPIDQFKDPETACCPKKPITILQIGSKALKNYERLIAATNNMDVNYIFVHGNTARINKLIATHNLSNSAKVYSGLSKSELLQLYLDADLLYFASLAEGFGMPLIEAQALGLPIITSNRDPMQAIAPWAIQVDPEQTEAIGKAINSFIINGVNSQELTMARAHVQRFAMRSVAEQYIQVYF